MGGRVVEGARLESVYTSKAYRGFESHPIRHYDVFRRSPSNPELLQNIIQIVGDVCDRHATSDSDIPPDLRTEIAEKTYVIAMEGMKQPAWA